MRLEYLIAGGLLVTSIAVAQIPSGGGSAVAWPSTGNVVISPGSSGNPSGVGEVDGDCLLGVSGNWAAGSCSGSGGGILPPATMGNNDFFISSGTNPSQAADSGYAIGTSGGSLCPVNSASCIFSNGENITGTNAVDNVSTLLLSGSVTYGTASTTYAGYKNNQTFVLNGNSSSVDSIEFVNHLQGSASPVSNVNTVLANWTLDSSFTGTLTAVNWFEANNWTNNSGIYPNNFFEYDADSHAPYDQVSTGTHHAYQFYGQGYTGTISGGTVDAANVKAILPSMGASGGTVTNRGIYITGAGGTSSGGTVNNYSIDDESSATAKFVPTVQFADGSTWSSSGEQYTSCTAQGDMLYVGSSGYSVCLTPGTQYQFLQTQGASANPKWASPEEDLMSNVYGSADWSQNTQYYMALMGWSSAVTTTFAVAEQFLPRAGTFGAIGAGQFVCNVNVAPGASQSDVCTLYNGSGATSVTCTISGTNTSCTDATHTVTATSNTGYAFGFIRNTGAADPVNVYESITFASP